MYKSTLFNPSIYESEKKKQSSLHRRATKYKMIIFAITNVNFDIVINFILTTIYNTKEALCYYFIIILTLFRHSR